MGTIIRFLLPAMLLVIVSNHRLSAQVPTTENDLELQIKSMQHQADSLKKEAHRLKDSLRAKTGHKDFGFLNSDSLMHHLPPSIEEWNEEIPKNFLFESPGIHEYQNYDWNKNPFIVPKEEKHKSPVPGFGGWYMQELAKL